MTINSVLDAREIHIIHLRQDDPKKCTARALQRRNLVTVHDKIAGPRIGIVLDPICGKVLGPEDINPKESPIIALDCSWKSIEVSIDALDRRANLRHRTLPLLLAASPVSWGKPGRLSTAEAMALCAAIMGRIEQAERILRPFRFGKEFLELNAEPIREYQECKTNQEIVEKQWSFFDPPND